MVCEHEATDTMAGVDVRRFASNGDLNGCGSPWNKIGHLALSNPEERLVNLSRRSGLASAATTIAHISRVNVSLNYVQD